LVVFKYLSKDHRPGFRSDKGDISEDEVGIYATVYEPQSMSMPVKHWMESQGSVIFTSTHSGEHQFCFYAAVRDPDSVRFRIEIHVEAGHQAIDYDNVAKVEHLSLVEVELRKIHDRVQEVYRERLYQREREEAFRNTSESTNSRVMWWSILELVIIVALNVVQVEMLKKFFRKKKIL